jgi:hypothetical protein
MVKIMILFLILEGWKVSNSKMHIANLEISLFELSKVYILKIRNEMWPVSLFN